MKNIIILPLALLILVLAPTARAGGNRIQISLNQLHYIPAPDFDEELDSVLKVLPLCPETSEEKKTCPNSSGKTVQYRKTLLPLQGLIHIEVDSEI